MTFCTLVLNCTVPFLLFLPQPLKHSVLQCCGSWPCFWPVRKWTPWQQAWCIHVLLIWWSDLCFQLSQHNLQQKAQTTMLQQQIVSSEIRPSCCSVPKSYILTYFKLQVVGTHSSPQSQSSETETLSRQIKFFWGFSSSFVLTRTTAVRGATKESNCGEVKEQFLSCHRDIFFFVSLPADGNPPAASDRSAQTPTTWS